jgi:hypothetical protein
MSKFFLVSFKVEADFDLRLNIEASRIRVVEPKRNEASKDWG